MRAARALLTRAAVVATAVGLASVVVAALTRGADGARAALLGVALVLVFLVVGQVPVAQVAAGRRRLGAALLVALYASRILLLVVAYAVVVAPGSGLDRQALGLAVLASAFGWTVGTVWSALRWRPYVVGPEGRG